MKPIVSTKNLVASFVFFLSLTTSLYAQCPTPPGDQSTYGADSWIGYVYNAVNSSNPPTNAFSTIYRGFITQPDIFNQDIGTGSISGANLCGIYADQFAIRYKMQKNLPAGNYSFTVGGDDGYRLSLDGGVTFPITSWNDHAYATSTATYYLSGVVNFVLEYYEQGGLSRISFSYGNCANPSTDASSITGITTLCTGNSTTLTAVGGTVALGSVYQWGTGSTIGSNIIAGQSGNAITITPLTTTTYWVRRIDPLPCNVITSGITQTVTVNPISTAPTSISGNTILCLGSSTTLTATGGSLAPGSSYEWGTGTTVGLNTIAGQTSNTLTIAPLTTTSYWARRVDTTPCANTTSGISTTVTVNTPSGDQTTYGTGLWIGYVYNPINSTNPPTNSFSTNYRGYITQSETFDLNSGTGAISGVNLCGTYTDQFAIRFKMQKNFIPGYYTFTVGGDDGYRLSLDGGITFPVNNYVDHAYTTTTSASFYLSGNVNMILEYYEQTGASEVSFSYTSCTTFSTAPTSISGITSLCNGMGGTTLTAAGGFEAPGATYQWGTGSVVGSNIIAGATTSSYYINPSTTTTYWVRRLDLAPCNLTSAGITQIITVSTPSSQPVSITGTTTICSGNSTTLTATGGTLGTGAVYQWGTGYSAGVNIIAGATGSSITVSPTSMTGYWVRRIDPAPCNTNTGQITTTVTVTATSTAPTSITGAGAPACAGTATTLTAVGGTAASGATYQWGTGSVIGSNIISGQTGISITVNPSTTTIYWVRRYDPSCLLYTTGVTTTISITTPPGNPAVAGINVWNAYGYSTGDITLATAVYAGYYSTANLNFDTQTGTNSWSSTTSPSNSAGWSGCPVPNDNFTFVAKRKGFPCGTYTLAMQNWDDAAQLYLNGSLIWSSAAWSGAGNYNVIVGSYNLDSTSEIEVRIRENTGNANVSLTLTNTYVASTAPTIISGTSTICLGSNTILTASGGTTSSAGAFQWGTGTIGSNIISGQTSASITINPTSDTTYWVRRADSVCNYNTAALTQLISVSPITVAGTLSTTNGTICRNTTASPIILSGNVGNVVKWQYADDATFTTGVNDIASTSTTLSSATIGLLTSTKYFRAVVQSGSCSISYTTPISITIPATVTYNGSWNGTPSATTPVVISGNLTLNSNLNVCSCQVTNAATVTVPDGVSLIVQKDLSVASTANIVIENNGSLIQVDNTASDIGNITFKRNTSPLKQYDYTYWSSPLSGQVLNQLGTPSLFYSFNPSSNNWSYESGSTTMSSAKGYIARAPDNLDYTSPQVVQTTFTGVPNNGIISAPIIKGSGTFNLIGNPYPSAIDIDAFLLDPANTSVVNGTIYLWTHNTAIANTVPGTNIYNYTRDDYAKYNITGGVQTASTAITGGQVPTGKIASGQAFFIEANSSLSNGTYSATFTNSMRIYNNNNQFFKVSPLDTNQPVANPTIQKNRVWLSLTNSNGAYDETLVGYITGATNGVDNLFDGKTFPAGNVVSIYSILDSSNYAIQGRALPFNDQDIIPLGITTSIGGDFTIGLENFDGLFLNQNVYLLDKVSGVYHNLKTENVTFNMAIGTDNNRFELHFSANTLGINNLTLTENTIHIQKINKHIEVQTDNFNISAVQVFDLLGKTIYNAKEVNSNDFKSPDFNLPTQILIVKVTSDNGQILAKKIIMN